MTKCVYHSRDMDGVASKEVVKRARHISENDCIGWDYGQDLSFLNNIDLGAEVIVTDISFPLNVMEELYKRFSLIWIDHHQTAIDALPDHYNGIRDRTNKKSACELCYNFLFPGKLVPKAITMLSLYDTWNHKEDEAILNFQSGLWVQERTSYLWDILLLSTDAATNMIDVISEKGAITRTYQTMLNKRYLRNAFETTFLGRNAIALNSSASNSHAFLDKINNYNVAILYYYSGKNKMWNYSIYSVDADTDCGLLAKEYGGGGHKGAAGFTFTKNIFDTNYV